MSKRMSSTTKQNGLPISNGTTPVKNLKMASPTKSDTKSAVKDAKTDGKYVTNTRLHDYGSAAAGSVAARPTAATPAVVKPTAARPAAARQFTPINKRVVKDIYFNHYLHAHLHFKTMDHEDFFSMVEHELLTHDAWRVENPWASWKKIRYQLLGTEYRIHVRNRERGGYYLCTVFLPE